MKNTQPILFSLILLTLTACAGGQQQFSEGYPRLVGKNVNQLVAVLGTPDSEQTIMGKKVYEWYNTAYGPGRGPVSGSSVFTGYAGIGLGTTFGDAPTTVAYNCALKVVTARNGMITESGYRGAASGCTKFGPGIGALTGLTPAP